MRRQLRHVIDAAGPDCDRDRVMQFQFRFKFPNIVVSGVKFRISEDVWLNAFDPMLLQILQHSATGDIERFYISDDSGSASRKKLLKKLCGFIQGACSHKQASRFAGGLQRFSG
jgi:hypothetical protein